MSEAPERIWAQATAVGWDEPIATQVRVDHFPEYIRADIHAAEVERSKALVEALREIRDENLIETRHFRGPSPEEEIGATVAAGQANYLQDISHDALAAYEGKNDG